MTSSLASSLPMNEALAQFGLSGFRRGQREVIEHVLSGRDCLCVMPTGGGKSLCYQLPSIIRPGLTIVVSPLIALMKDQVDTLVKRGVRATLINSSLSLQEQNERLDQVTSGYFRMLYVAPERLRNSKFLDSIRATPIQLLAIDEAHCISEWGHDFRPDYQRLGRFREALGNVQTIALTATATPRVREDILNSLKLQTAKTFITGFARDNLYFGSIHCMSDREKDKQLHRFLEDRQESGIIYVATRKRCEALVDQLAKELRLSVGAYHAGLLPEQRKLIQEQFMAGKLKAIVATNAFGMGIDKSDLRYVIHYNMPGTLEAYYQEAGRAGRDGLQSQCVLLYNAQDRYIQEFFIENANPSRAVLQTVYEFLLTCEDDPIEMTAEEIREQIGQSASSEAINSSLQILARTGVLERLEVAGGLAMFRLSSRMSSFIDLLPRDATVRRTVLRAVEKGIGDRRDESVYIHPRWLMDQLSMDRDTLFRHLRELNKLEDFEFVRPFRGRAIHFRRRDVAFDQLPIDHEALAARKKADYEKLDQMVAYAKTTGCRQKAILDYFGDTTSAKCGICDRCQGKAGWPKLPKSPSKSKRADETPLLEYEAESQIETQPTRVSGIGLPADTTSSRTPHSERATASDSPTIEASTANPSPPLPPDTPYLKEARALIQTVLSAIERTHGYLSKTVLTQHFSGVASKAVTGLRLQRLAEFGILKDWKKSHASGLVERLMEQALIAQSELKMGKQTVAITERGMACIQKGDEIPTEILQFVIQAMEPPKKPNPSPQQSSLPKEEPRKPTTLSVEKEPSVRHSDQLPVPSRQDAENAITSGTMLDDWQWTLRMVKHGYRLGECALIRGKTPDGVLADLIAAMECGERVDIQRLFDAKTVQAIEGLSHEVLESDSPPVALQAFSSLWPFAVRWTAKRTRS